MRRPGKVKGRKRMSAQAGKEWLAWVAKMSVEDVDRRLPLTDEQWSILGEYLSKNQLLNPPKERHVKMGTFVCQCGCGERFTAAYVTRRPKFKNNAHRMRYWRRKMKAEGK